jgi:predicted permease
MPLHGGGERYRFTLDAQANASSAITPESGTIIVTPGYFTALGIPILRGRDFTQADLDTSAPVLIANQTLARRLWPGQDPIGRFVWLGPKAKYQIIGVAGDVRHEGLREKPGAAIYGPISHFPRSTLKIFVRTAGDPRSLAAPVRATIRAIDPDQPISEIAPLPEIVSETVARPRFYSVMLAIFAGLALLLAGSGLYGVISYGVQRRTREIGVRMALGAVSEEVLAMVVREGLRVCAIGVAIGLVLSAAATRFLSSLLFGVSATDPAVFAGAALFLLGVGALAAYAPARRASRIDPMTALRWD